MSRTFFNHRAASWDETVAERDEAKLALMAARLNINRGATVLDVGSGTGVFLPFLLSKVGSGGRIIALDIAEKMLQKARAKGYENIVYLNADVAHLPLVDEVFDCVVCYSSFPHFQNRRKALVEINRVTKTGGYLFICHTSSRASINEIHNGIPELANDLIPDEEEMRAMLSEAGFSDIRIEDSAEDYLCQARKDDI